MEGLWKSMSEEEQSGRLEAARADLRSQLVVNFHGALGALVRAGVDYWVPYDLV